jgi:flagellar biosynthesis protein FliR
MIKILLILLIVAGGFGLMARYAPQLLGAQLFNIAGFTITGGLVLLVCLIGLGVKFVSHK